MINRLIDKSIGTIWEWFWIYIIGILASAVLIGTFYGIAFLFNAFFLMCGSSK